MNFSYSGKQLCRSKPVFVLNRLKRLIAYDYVKRLNKHVMEDLECMPINIMQKNHAAIKATFDDAGGGDTDVYKVLAV